MGKRALRNRAWKSYRGRFPCARSRAKVCDQPHACTLSRSRDPGDHPGLVLERRRNCNDDSVRRFEAEPEKGLRVNKYFEHACHCYLPVCGSRCVATALRSGTEHRCILTAGLVDDRQWIAPHVTFSLCQLRLGSQDRASKPYVKPVEPLGPSPWVLRKTERNG